jgi:hypothetical protein
MHHPRRCLFVVHFSCWRLPAGALDLGLVSYGVVVGSLRGFGGRTKVDDDSTTRVTQGDALLKRHRGLLGVACGDATKDC